MWKLNLWKPGSDFLFLGWHGGRYVSGISQSKIDEWVHVACVYTGRKLEDDSPEIMLYLDGELCEHRQTRNYQFVDTDISSSKSKPVRMGASMVADERSGTVDGDLDELYIIRGTLNQDEIQRLMKYNQLKFSR